MIPKITLSLLSLQYKKYISFFSNVVGSLLAATSSMLCFFLDQNKYYRPEDGFPASNDYQAAKHTNSHFATVSANQRNMFYSFIDFTNDSICAAMSAENL